LNKYIKCNFGGLRCGTSTIVDVRRLKVKQEVPAINSCYLLRNSRALKASPTNHRNFEEEKLQKRATTITQNREEREETRHIS